MKDFKNFALLIIDMQNFFLDLNSPLFIEKGLDIISNVKRILEFARKNKINIFYIKRETRPYAVDIDKSRLKLFNEKGGFLLEGSLDSQIVKDLEPQNDEIILIKKRWSAFFYTELDLILRRLKVDTLIITGVQTPNCIRATVMDGLSLDYDCIVLEDGTASRTYEVQSANLLDMKNMGAKIMKTDELIGYLLG